jgi:hypothetical protein
LCYQWSKNTILLLGTLEWIAKKLLSLVAFGQCHDDDEDDEDV